MANFRCKICGGSSEIKENQTIMTCDYCGNTQTLPRLTDDRRANMYDRANHFRRNNEFDKAMGMYEQILNEDTTDAEAYWSLVLCRYGIEYVEDPATKKHVPTVNRAQFTSILADENYRSALQYADTHQKAIYEEEARHIDKIQKDILAISQKEEPFDVFICYKETDANGDRTPDSVLAQELYYGLKDEGFKVFFARITLEDKLGSAYEPYIFAALNSSKVMVVLGTKPEYFNAPWVKNEWSRYLALIKQNNRRVIVPAYKDMDPYDLPEEFSHLQAQDMSKLGFMQDLIRGIKKIAKPQAQNVEKVVVTPQAPQISLLLKRMFIFLEDGEFSRADEFCEQILNQDPESAEAYLGKFMIEKKVRSRGEIFNLDVDFSKDRNFIKAARYANEKLKAELNKCIADAEQRKINRAKDNKYNDAIRYMERGGEFGYNAAIEKLKDIPGWRDADDLIIVCYEKIEEEKNRQKDEIYKGARALMDSGSVEGYQRAILEFETIPGWRDANGLIGYCNERIREQRDKESEIIYVRGREIMTEGNRIGFEEALKYFEAIPEWRDSANLISYCKSEITRLTAVEEEAKRRRDAELAAEQRAKAEREAKEAARKQRKAQTKKVIKGVVAAILTVILIPLTVLTVMSVMQCMEQATGIDSAFDFHWPSTILITVWFILLGICRRCVNKDGFYRAWIVIGVIIMHIVAIVIAGENFYVFGEALVVIFFQVTVSAIIGNFFKNLVVGKKQS